MRLQGTRTLGPAQVPNVARAPWTQMARAPWKRKRVHLGSGALRGCLRVWVLNPTAEIETKTRYNPKPKKGLPNRKTLSLSLSVARNMQHNRNEAEHVKVLKLLALALETKPVTGDHEYRTLKP